MQFDWAGLMRLGLRGLGLRPADFWALTPVELLILSGAGDGAADAPLGRAQLEELIRQYPDRTEDKSDD